MAIGSARKKKTFLPIYCANPLCHQKFTPTRKDQKYHSGKCRDAMQKIARGYTPTMTKCPQCKNDFLNLKPGRQIYCSPECRNEHQSSPDGQTCANCKTDCEFPRFIVEFALDRTVMCFNRQLGVILQNTWCDKWTAE